MAPQRRIAAIAFSYTVFGPGICASIYYIVMVPELLSCYEWTPWLAQGHWSREGENKESRGGERTEKD